MTKLKKKTRAETYLPTTSPQVSAFLINKQISACCHVDYIYKLGVGDLIISDPDRSYRHSQSTYHRDHGINVLLLLLPNFPEFPTHTVAFTWVGCPGILIPYTSGNPFYQFWGFFNLSDTTMLFAID